MSLLYLFYVFEHLVHAFMTRCLDYCNALIVFSVGYNTLLNCCLDIHGLKQF